MKKRDMRREEERYEEGRSVQRFPRVKHPIASGDDEKVHTTLHSQHGHEAVTT